MSDADQREAVQVLTQRQVDVLAANYAETAATIQSCHERAAESLTKIATELTNGLKKIMEDHLATLRQGFDSSASRIMAQRRPASLSAETKSADDEKAEHTKRNKKGRASA